MSLTKAQKSTLICLEVSSGQNPHSMTGSFSTTVGFRLASQTCVSEHVCASYVVPMPLGFIGTAQTVSTHDISTCQNSAQTLLVPKSMGPKVSNASETPAGRREPPNRALYMPWNWAFSTARSWYLGAGSRAEMMKTLCQAPSLTHSLAQNTRSFPP